MLTLFAVPGAGVIRSMSPFCWKTEALLKLSGQPYQVEMVADLSTMPKGKVPVLKDGDRQIPDSSHIQRHLEHHYGLNLDAHLTPQQKAIAEAFRRMAEEHLYWAIVYSRWIDKNGREFMLNGPFGALPESEREKAFQFMQGVVVGEMNGHGIGRHEKDAIYAFAAKDLDAIADYLGDNTFFFGDTLTSVDAVLATLVASFVHNPFDTDIVRYAKTKANLTTYANRFEQTVFGCYIKNNEKTDRTLGVSRQSVVGFGTFLTPNIAVI